MLSPERHYLKNKCMQLVISTLGFKKILKKMKKRLDTYWFYFVALGVR